MKQKKCLYCGKMFTPRPGYPYQKYCDGKCRNRYLYEKNRGSSVHRAKMASERIARNKKTLEYANGVKNEILYHYSVNGHCCFCLYSDMKILRLWSGKSEIQKALGWSLPRFRDGANLFQKIRKEDFPIAGFKTVCPNHYAELEKGYQVTPAQAVI